MMGLLAFLASLIILVLGVVLFCGIISFFVQWVCEKDIKKTWLAKLFVKNYIEYNNKQDETICFYTNEEDWRLRRYVEKKIKDLPTISLEQFKDFYHLNPDSWSLRFCRVVKDNNDELSFTFTYPEWKKYQKFREQVEEENKNQQERLKTQKLEKEKVETTKKVLEAVQKDIDKIRAEAEKEFEEVKNAVEVANCEHEWKYVQDKWHESNVMADLFVCKKCGQIKIVRGDKYDLR